MLTNLRSFAVLSAFGVGQPNACGKTITRTLSAPSAAILARSWSIRAASNPVHIADQPASDG